MHRLLNLPLDSEAGNSWLLGEDVAADLLEDWLGWGIGVELLRVILVVDIVADSNELATVIGAGEEDDGDTEDLSIRDSGGVWCTGLEDELVDANWDGANEEGIELLVMLIAAEELAR